VPSKRALVYKGQNPRVEDEADEFSTWHDLSDPNLIGTDREPEDALDPDRPTGAAAKKACVRWYRHENVRKQ